MTGVPRGAPGRVAAVHAQTRRGLLVAFAFVVAGVVAAIAGAGFWVALHLFTVGALLSAISATTQMLAVTWSAAPSPEPVVARTQRWMLAAGAVALVVGHELDLRWVFVAGGSAVVLAMVALASILVGVRRRSVTDRFAPAIEAYVAAVALGSVAMPIGILIGSGQLLARAGTLRGVHLLLNLFGLVGIVVAATLPYFAATQVRSKMSRRATPTAMRLTFMGLAGSALAAAAAEALDRPVIVAGALVGYAVGLLAVAVMMPIYAPRRLRWGGPRVVQLLAGLAWWIAMTLALAITKIAGTDDRAIVRALVIGGFAQILVASLAYLGPVLRGGGHHLLAAGFVLTRSWVSLGAGNLAALAALAGEGLLLASALVVWLIDVAVRGALLIVGARRRIPT